MKNTQVEKVCLQCSKPFKVPLAHVYRIFRCSRLCADRSRRADGIEYNGRWYTINRYGYYVRYGPKLLHREIWEEAYGAIPPIHDIHHKNSVRTDNRLDNLELISHSEHARQHTLERHAKRKNALVNK